MDKKIKVLQYVSCMNRAGAETLLMNIYRNIDRNKFEFHFISHTKEKCDYDDEIRELGGQVIYLERPSLKNMSKYKGDFKKIVDTYGPYNAIHTHMQLMNGLILNVAKECGINIRISHAHSNGDCNQSSILRNMYEKYSKYLIKKFETRKLACSTLAGEYLYEGREFELMNNAIDLKAFDHGNTYSDYLRAEFKLNKDIKVITHIGRFVEAKNHKFIIEVFSELIKEDKNYRLFLCGDGYLKSEIEQKVKELNIESYVYFLGVREDINKILLGTDIFFMPSILEGLPVTLVEAQAAGCQCLISDNIPKEVDLNLQLIKYCSLKDSISEWIMNLKNLEKDFNINFEMRKKYIDQAGYDIEKNIQKLEKIYVGESV